MANTIIPKKSVVSGRVPTTNDIKLGEVSINHADRVFFSRHPQSGAVQQIGAAPVHTHVLTDITDLGDLVLEADWNEIINKPAAFPPETHTHSISEVDGLEAALDAAGGSGTAPSDSYTEPTYTGGVITSITTWSDSTKAVLVQSRAFSYTAGRLTQITTTDATGTTTFTKTLTYSGDTLVSITEDYT
jgi:hypothetical protein